MSDSVFNRYSVYFFFYKCVDYYNVIRWIRRNRGVPVLSWCKKVKEKIIINLRGVELPVKVVVIVVFVCVKVYRSTCIENSSYCCEHAYTFVKSFNYRRQLKNIIKTFFYFIFLYTLRLFDNVSFTVKRATS